MYDLCKTAGVQTVVFMLSYHKHRLSDKVLLQQLPVLCRLDLCTVLVTPDGRESLRAVSTRILAFVSSHDLYALHVRTVDVQKWPFL